MATSIAKTKTLFKKAFYYNWDNGLDGLEKVLRDRNCDKATAVMIFWRGHPGYYYNNPDIEKMESHEKAAFEFLKSLAGDIVSNKYFEIISFSPEKEFIPETLGNIPAELIQEVKGTINYKEVLFPNNNPFDEQIMALCKNCDDINKMFALEKEGADFSLKINNGYSYPIKIACGSGQTEAIKYFIEKGYDLNKKYDKMPLFWSAVTNKKIPAINLILENGGKINQKGEFGRTILHGIAGWFAENQDYFDDTMKKIIILLIEKGADIHAKDSSKKTPLDLAIMWNNVKYIDYLNEIENDKIEKTRI
ncbi:DUF4274 domain-containing protein [Chryseobacterium sp. 2987]|uniref:DUF4274 domain-containing protein n=1 Tax=Chryseobacterium sp. 2987 TaxID=2817767 RepID=UPI00286CFA7C|nr:DUF4274 domain-containing protein [Chryseobacterium sp. 2987]